MANTAAAAATKAKDAVFVEARDQFLKSLLPNEQAQLTKCNSAQQLLEQTKNLPALAKNAGLRRTCVQRISDLGTKLSPYFESMGWIVQSNPEFAAIGWGAFKLVLQLASNYTSFFEKLLRTLHRLATEFPPYELLAMHKKEAIDEPMSAAIYHGISALYTSLLRFLHQVVRVFRKKDGAAKWMPKVAANIAWKPFDRWFSDLLEDIEMHRKVVGAQIQVFLSVGVTNIQTDLEMSLSDERKLKINQKKLQEEIDKMVRKEDENAQDIQRESRASTLARLRQWISPPEFALEFENALETREEGTAEWLFSYSTFVDWDERKAHDSVQWSKDMVLWVHGNPGSGKTIQAASTVQELRNNPNENVCYFFYRANDPGFEKPLDAYRSILAQTLRFHHNDLCLLDKFTFMLEEQSSGQSTISTKEALDLIKICATDGYIQRIVLDALDECTDWPKAMHPRSGLPVALSETATKLMIFSRPHLRVLPLLSKCNAIEVGNSTSEDIEILIQRRLESFVDEGLLPIDADVAELGQRLHTGADSMILWAHLMLEYLQSFALTASRRVEIIQSVTLPEGLDKMYDRIIEALLNKNLAENRLAVWLLMWLSYSGRPLTATELHITTQFMNSKNTATSADFTNFGHTVISTCASIVEESQMVDPIQQKIVPCYRLIHLSAREYFSTRISKKAQQFMMSPRDAHHDLASCCLQYFETLGPTQCLEATNGQSLDASHFDEQYPFCSYASQYWTYHLLRAEKATQNVDPASTPASPPFSESQELPLHAINGFLDRSEILKAYIQARYTFDGPSEGMFGLKAWSERALKRCGAEGQDSEGCKILQKLHDFAAYLELLDLEWGAKLCSRPSLIWHEVTAFTSSNLITSSGTKLHPLVSRSIGQPELSSRPLSQISEVNKEQEFISILTIWPSQAYEKWVAACRDRDHFPIGVRESCSGWMVCYEVWWLKDIPKRIQCVRAPLDEEEVWRQCCHSLSCVVLKEGHLKLKPQAEWRLQFPIAISPCLYKFSVLRTIYTLEVADENKAVALQQVKLPFESYSDLHTSWPVNAPPRLSNSLAAFSRSAHAAEIYMYWIAFDASGDSLFFSARTLRHYVHIGYFQIWSSDQGVHWLPVVPISSFTTVPYDQASMEVNIAKPAFHPAQCLIAFSSGPDVYLWAYTRRRLGMPDRNLKLAQLNHTDPNLTLWTIYNGSTGFTSADSICFSADGRYLVIHVASRLHPVIVPIPGRIFDISETNCRAVDSLVSTAVSNSMSNAIRQNRLLPTATGMALQTHSADTTVGNSTTLKFGELAAGPTAGGDDIAVFSITTDSSVELQLSGSSRSTKVQLLQLPDSWTAMSAVKASMGMHPTKQDILRIILNHSQRPWYSINETEKRKAVSIIDRKVSEVMRANPTIESFEGHAKGNRLIQNTPAYDADAYI